MKRWGVDNVRWSKLNTRFYPNIKPRSAMFEDLSVRYHQRSGVIWIVEVVVLD